MKIYAFLLGTTMRDAVEVTVKPADNLAHLYTALATDRVVTTKFAASEFDYYNAGTLKPADYAAAATPERKIAWDGVSQVLPNSFIIGKRPDQQQGVAPGGVQRPGMGELDASGGGGGDQRQAVAPGGVQQPGVDAADAGGGVGGSGDAGVAAVLRRLETKVTDLQQTVAAQGHKQELERLDKLLVKPTYSPASYASSRSPRPEERFPLKEATIEYYGLWENKAQKTVFTMLQPQNPAGPAPGPAARRTAVPLKDAIMAHIWPSAQSTDSIALAAQLGLPADFNVDPRNFLILHKDVEKAYDAHALLLMPRKAAGALSPSAVARPFARLAGRLAGFNANNYAGSELFLPKAADGHVPFMRLLAWKTVSALRAVYEEADAVASLPGDLELDATVTGDSRNTVAQAVGALRSHGARFLPLV